MKRVAIKIGVISDTHNHFDLKIPTLFAGVHHILHAGDVGAQQIITRLEQIAPVTAVLGNTDEFLDVKLTESIELGGRKFLVHHIVNPRALDDKLKARITREKPYAVIFGHTHKPFHETVGGVFYFNPGYAGQQRFDLLRSLAILHCDEQGVRHEYLSL